MFGLHINFAGVGDHLLPPSLHPTSSAPSSGFTRALAERGTIRKFYQIKRILIRLSKGVRSAFTHARKSVFAGMVPGTLILLLDGLMCFLLRAVPDSGVMREGNN